MFTSAERPSQGYIGPSSASLVATPRIAYLYIVFVIISARGFTVTFSRSYERGLLDFGTDEPKTERRRPSAASSIDVGVDGKLG